MLLETPQPIIPNLRDLLDAVGEAFIRTVINSADTVAAHAEWPDGSNGWLYFRNGEWRFQNGSATAFGYSEACGVWATRCKSDTK